jgi:hypothetical protein
MTTTNHRRAAFTPKEIGAFKLYVIEMVVIGTVLVAMAPSASGKVAGLIFSVVLIPVPPIVIYIYRRHNGGDVIVPNQSKDPAP